MNIHVAGYGNTYGNVFFFSWELSKGRLLEQMADVCLTF